MQRRVDRNQSKGRYTLALAMLIVRQYETMPTRRAVFDEIKAKNRIIRWVAKTYDLGGPTLVRRVLLCVYMLKCVLSMPTRTPPAADGLAIATFANEVHTIGWMSALVPDIDIALLRPNVRNAIWPSNMIAGLRFLAAVPKLWRIMGVLSRRYDFMPACRISSVIAYYFSFGPLLDGASEATFAVASSNYSPEAVALAAAAHGRGMRLIYVNHAPVPRNSAYVPPVLSDIAVFYGDMVRETYAQRSRCIATPIYLGQPGQTAAMVLAPNASTIGIFLTALTRKDTISRLIDQARAIDPKVQFLIRHHPVSLIETDLSDISDSDPGVRVTIGTSLDDDIVDCDVVLCGNSGVTLNALRRGRPVGYVAALDGLPFDYNGFVVSGVVAELDHWTAQSFANLKAFYTTAAWHDVMIRYDASYGRDQTQVDADARASLISALRD